MIQDQVRARKIDQYNADDVEWLCGDYLNDFKTLHNSGMYDHSLTLVMMEEIMEGGEGNEDFRSPLRTIKEKLSEKVLNIRHMGYEQAFKYMADNDVDPRSILTECKTKYRNLLDGGKWGPANHAKDSKALDKNYGRVNMVDGATSDLKNYVNQLVQGQMKRDKSKDKCNGCGKLGHWEKDCPSRKNKGVGKRPNPKKSNKGKGARAKTGRTPPPKPGESEIKMIDGKKKYWCAKCNRWTISHRTDSHKSKEELTKERGGPKAAGAQVSFHLHPSAFLCKHRD